MQVLMTSHCTFATGNRLLLKRPQSSRQVVANQCTVAKASRASDFRRLTEDEIEQQVQDAKRSLLIDFRVKQVRSQTKPKCQLKWDLETKIAQLLTVKRERELENSTNKRESRRKQR